MQAIIFGLITFIIIYLIYYYLILKRKYKSKKKQNSIYKQMEISYLISRFKLDSKKIKMLYLIRIIALINAFIIAFTSTVIYYIPLDAIIWKFLIGFVIVFGLIYAIYELLGRFLVKKGWQK